MQRIAIALALTLCVIPSVHAATPESIRKMEGAVLNGDGAEARRYSLQALDEGLEAADAAYASCVRGRLNQPPAPVTELPPFVSRVLSVYQDYWYRSLVDSATRADNESNLEATLATLLQLPPDTPVEALETTLQHRLAEEGYFALLGFTPPLRELMLWRTQTSQTFDVVLPEEHHGAHVIMLDGFPSLGWAAWGTCGTRSTGGWATDTTLYAVMPRYAGGVGSNAFLAVLLTHETQHFADKNVFKALQPWELEYRAKLAELWAADAQVAVDRLGKFRDSQSEDTALAHPYANARVLAALSRRLGQAPESVDTASLHAAAADLLRQDTESRRATGAH